MIAIDSIPWDGLAWFAAGGVVTISVQNCWRGFGGWLNWVFFGEEPPVHWERRHVHKLLVEGIVAALCTQNETYVVSDLADALIDDMIASGTLPACLARPETATATETENLYDYQ